MGIGEHHEVREGLTDKLAPDILRCEMRFTTLGTIDLDATPDAARLLAQPKLLTLFAYLVLARRGGYQRRERLCGLFWPEQSEDRARGSLRSALRSLRELLGDDRFLRRGDTDVAINLDGLTCDAFEFEDAIERDELASALELYRGPLLDGLFPESVALQHWLDERRAEFRSAAANAAWTLAERYESQVGDLTSAARWARKAAKLAGADERRVRRVMELLARAADIAGALAVYNEFAKYLKKELDVAPSRETQDLADAIRARA
jgi:DNA-binding SARP family transcriptional activator